jgi:hypothetical protein
MKIRALLLSPELWLALVFLAGASLVTSGVAMQWGASWALIVMGAFLLWVAAFIRKGLS